MTLTWKTVLPDDVDRWSKGNEASKNLKSVRKGDLMLCMYFLYEITVSVTRDCHYSHIVDWEIKGKGKKKRENILYIVWLLKTKTKPNNPEFPIS